MGNKFWTSLAILLVISYGFAVSGGFGITWNEVSANRNEPIVWALSIGFIIFLVLFTYCVRSAAHKWTEKEKERQANSKKKR